MTYEFRTLPDAQILEVKMQGLLNSALRAEVLCEASAKLGINEYNRLLVNIFETTISEKQLSFDAYPLVDVLKKNDFKPPKKIAFLKKEDHVVRTLFEKVAQQEGFNVKYFYSRDEALVWLCQS
ncbi:MAG: hypothetical protein GY714_02930 [Desulfobacterales bacterium]|nr:hypothetical protein [Desulfobacterales bacterium]MCP4163490.1 hypothetical protein [Deltaproteobacteria bacterium]